MEFEITFNYKYLSRHIISFSAVNASYYRYTAIMINKTSKMIINKFIVKKCDDCMVEYKTIGNQHIVMKTYRTIYKIGYLHQWIIKFDNLLRSFILFIIFL